MTTINKIAKAGVIGTLLMGAVALKATNPITNVNKTPNQTEVVSREGAEALKTLSLQSVNQTTVPTIRNQRIDNTFRKFATNEEEKKQINSIINGMYTNKGTFLASAQMQHELDRQQLFLLLEEKGDMLVKNGLNPKLGKEISEYGSDFYKSVRPNAKKVDEWLDKDYSPKLLGLLYFDHKPTAEEVIKRLDDIAENKANFTSGDKMYYKTSSDNFIRKFINNKKDNMSLSELIAFKIFTIDKMIFKKTLTNNNFFGENSKFNKYAGLIGFYDDWMNTVEPKGK